MLGHPAITGRSCVLTTGLSCLSPVKDAPRRQRQEPWACSPVSVPLPRLPDGPQLSLAEPGCRTGHPLASMMVNLVSLHEATGPRDLVTPDPRCVFEGASG